MERISYMHLERVFFDECLLANNKNMLLDYLFRYNMNINIPIALHEQLMVLYKEYFYVGGLPEVVKCRS